MVYLCGGCGLMDVQVCGVVGLERSIFDSDDKLEE